MTFQPVLPLSGFAGWAFLSRTLETQQTAFNQSPLLQRNVEHFTENIGSIATAEDLVNDRQLLEVALGAFGLSEDINNKYFLQAILQEGTIDPTSLANKLSDKRYRDFSEAFGFGDFSTPNTALSDFPEKITQLYLQQDFEVAVGNVDEDLRMALSLDRALDEIVAADTTDNGRWFEVMGQPPVRTVFERALALPTSFGALDLDQQLNGFRDSLNRRFGDGEIGQFSDPEKREELIRLFLVQSEIQNGPTAATSSSTALTLLQSIG